MARLLSVPQKFTVADWQIAKHLRFNRSEYSRLEAESLIAESNRFVNDVRKLTHETTADTNKELERRIDDVDYWRSEVGRRQISINSEIDHLNSYKTRLDFALENVQTHFEIVNQCLTLREQRIGIDLVHDSVQENLLKERDVVIGVKNMMKSGKDELLEQIRLARRARYYLENNLCDKTIALRVDNIAINMTPHTRDLFDSSGQNIEPFIPPSKQPPITAEQERDFTVHDWRKVTTAILSKAESELNHSLQMRGVIDGILSQTASDLRYQFNATDHAFYERIREMKAVANQLEEEHAELERQTNAMEYNLENLLKAIADLERPYALAQSRVTMRASKRPNVESCMDPPQIHLHSELDQLSDSLITLQQKVKQTEQMLHKLIRNKLEVADDIKIKNNSIYIDEVQCASLRRSVTITQY